MRASVNAALITRTASQIVTEKCSGIKGVGEQVSLISKKAMPQGIAFARRSIHA